MSVKELIELLKKYDENNEVTVLCPDGFETDIFGDISEEEGIVRLDGQYNVKRNQE